MSEVDSVPDHEPTLIRRMGHGTWDIPTDWISYRLTIDDNNFKTVSELFKGTCYVAGHEVSRTGVSHYHIVVAGHDHYETIRKRITRAKFGTNKSWSKKNHGEFLKAVSYTVKCGDIRTTRGFHGWVDCSPEWEFGQELEVCAEVKDTSRDWMLTWNNLLAVAMNWRNRYNLQTDKLGDVLEHMEDNSKWIPSPQMLKNGIDKYFHLKFTRRCQRVKTGKPHRWWEERVEAF